MRDRSVARDERTVSVENASYRWAYLVLSFGLLLIVAYRSFALGDSSWDLLVLVVVGGLVATYYQGINRVLTRRWALMAVASFCLAGLIALVSLFLR